jgi:hypothetical protein
LWKLGVQEGGWSDDGDAARDFEAEYITKRISLSPESMAYIGQYRAMFANAEHPAWLGVGGPVGRQWTQPRLAALAASIGVGRWGARGGSHPAPPSPHSTNLGPSLGSPVTGPIARNFHVWLLSPNIQITIPAAGSFTDFRKREEQGSA